MSSNIGLYKGKLHSEGGIPETVIETGRKIEVEADEYRLCSEILESNKVYEFVNKTNREILDTLHKASCTFEQGKIPAGSFIICRLAVLDDTKRNIYGTIREIINVMQGDHSCRLFGSDGNEMKNGGEVCGCQHFDMGGIIEDMHSQELSGTLRDYIMEILINDKRKFYDYNTISLIADGIMKVDKTIFEFNPGNPIITKYKEKVYFFPDAELINNEGGNMKNAYIKYGAHLVATKKQGDIEDKRYYDRHKEEAIPLIKLALQKGERYIQTTNGNIVYALPLEEKKHLSNILTAEINLIGQLRVVTILPDIKKIKAYWKYAPINITHSTTSRLSNPTGVSQEDIKDSEQLEIRDKGIQNNYIPDKNDEKSEGYGCLMLGIHVPVWPWLLKEIKPEDIYDEPGFGLEKEPHITLLYGFHDKEVNPQSVLSESKKYISGDTTIKLTGISLFENDSPYDVVKFDVEGEVLHKINTDLVKNFPNTQIFPEYHPHATIAYVKKGTGKKYIKQLPQPLIVNTNELIYSHPDDSYGGTGENKEVIKLDGISEAAKEAMIHRDTFNKIQSGKIETVEQLGESLAEDHGKEMKLGGEVKNPNEQNFWDELDIKQEPKTIDGVNWGDKEIVFKDLYHVREFCVKNADTYKCITNLKQLYGKDGRLYNFVGLLNDKGELLYELDLLNIKNKIRHLKKLLQR